MCIRDRSRVKSPPGKQVQIAVMLRSDVFRESRSRTINSTPGPVEVFNIVNRETALHLSEQPLYLPDLGEVLAESEWLSKASWRKEKPPPSRAEEERLEPAEP